MPEKIDLPVIREAIDLGLSVKWASCNVGAAFPEEYGDYYAWAETTTKSNYSTRTSFIHNVSISEMKSRGVIDSNNNLTAAYDAATTNWGDSWRMPTSAEFEELVDKCTWKRTTKHGIKGCKITGPNGNSIFLPATAIRHNLYPSQEGNVVNYRSATCISEVDNGATLRYYYHTVYGDICTIGNERGLPVRPVYGIRKLDVYVTTGDAMDITDNSVVLNGEIRDSDNSVDCGVIYGTSSSLSSSSGIKKSTTSSNAYSVTLSGLSSNTVYYYRAFAVIDSEYKYGDVWSFTTKNDNPTMISGREAVDLGLSVKWASCNVGATSSEDIGGFYAWGETEERDCDAFDDYKWDGGSYDAPPTKYSKTVDNKTTLDPEDDVAHVKWGGGWRMPAFSEVKELIDCCTREWIIVNGVYGSLLTGPNGNSIFLPASGKQHDASVYLLSFGVDCWSATLSENDDEDAYRFFIDDERAISASSPRYFIQSVRPVIDN